MSDILSYKTDQGRKSAHWSYGPSFDKVLPVHTEVTLATSPAPYTSRSLWESYQLDYWYDKVSNILYITTWPSVCKIGSLYNDLFSQVQFFLLSFPSETGTFSYLTPKSTSSAIWYFCKFSPPSHSGKGGKTPDFDLSQTDRSTLEFSSLFPYVQYWKTKIGILTLKI